MSDRGRPQLRRAAPPFRRCVVDRVVHRTSAMVRVTLRGPGLVGLDCGAPAASVRLLLPGPTGVLELPEWNGNEFLRADGTRPSIRTLTPVALRDDGADAELDVDVVLHDESPLTAWVLGASGGTPAAVSGTGSGHVVDPQALDVVLYGDESAAPAVATLLEALPAEARVRAHLEHRSSAEPVPLPEHPGAEVHWSVQAPDAAPGDSLVVAAARVPVDGGTRVWAAGEAAAVQRLRRVLFDERGVDRSRAVVRGYWKLGRPGT